MGFRYFGVLLLFLFVTRSTNSERPSREFLKQEKERATQAVYRYCDKPEYSFIKCERDPSDSSKWKTAGGTFGVGVYASIKNNPQKYKITVYRNCRMMMKDRVIRPLFSSSNLINPIVEPELPVFIKVAQHGLAELSEKASTDHRISYFEKEARRSRVFANKKISPDYYDIKDSNTGQLHSIHKEAYLVKQVNGLSATELIDNIIKSLKLSLKDKLKNILGYYETDLKSNAPGYHPKTVKATEVLIVETWLWARLVIKLFNAVFDFVDNMWSKNLRHCDCHFSNIMFVSQVINDQETLTESIRDELVYVPGIAATRISLQKGDAQTPATVFPLTAASITVIDLAYAFDITGNRKDHPHLTSPCLRYRAARNEDSYELYRSIKFYDKTFAFINNSWQDIKKAASEEYMLWNRFTIEKSDLLSVMDLSIQQIQTNFGTIGSRLIENNPEWQSCVNSNQEYKLRNSSIGKKTSSVDKSKFHLNADHQCSVVQEEIGLKKAREFLAHQTTVLCDSLIREIPHFGNNVCGALRSAEVRAIRMEKETVNNIFPHKH